MYVKSHGFYKEGIMLLQSADASGLQISQNWTLHRKRTATTAAG